MDDLTAKESDARMVKAQEMMIDPAVMLLVLSTVEMSEPLMDESIAIEMEILSKNKKENTSDQLTEEALDNLLANVLESARERESEIP